MKPAEKVAMKEDVYRARYEANVELLANPPKERKIPKKFLGIRWTWIFYLVLFTIVPGVFFNENGAENAVMAWVAVVGLNITIWPFHLGALVATVYGIHKDRKWLEYLKAKEEWEEGIQIK